MPRRRSGCGSAELVVGNYDDPAALAALCDGLEDGRDAITYEFENVPTAALDWLARERPGLAVHPGMQSLSVSSDRLREKDVFLAVGVPLAPWARVDRVEDLAAAAESVGVPGVLKLRSGGYDGRGQVVVAERSQLIDAWVALGNAPCVYEAFVKFRREVSVVGARGADGSTACYPVVENVHRGGILHETHAPAAGLAPAVDARARAWHAALCERLGHVGVLAIELFEVEADGEPQLFANETASRVHNSGHWTMDACSVGQFELHVRAVLGMGLGMELGIGLGDVGMRAGVGAACMVNVIGDEPGRPDELAGTDGVTVHLYGKQPRGGRKLGHVNVVAPDRETLEARLARVREGVGMALGASGA
jgi:5-(carboxyamino)imidazole ribonucleotide synthase